MGNGPSAGESASDRTVVAVEAATYLRPSDRNGKWTDWFVCPIPLAQRIKDVPGVRVLRNAYPLVHLSHLPVLGEMVPDLEVIKRPGGMIWRWGEVKLSETGTDANTWSRCKAAGWCPRPYQLTGANFIRARAGALIADQMRLGKTLQVAMAWDRDSGPMVVAGPLNVRPVWTKLFAKLWPDIEPVILDGREYDVSRIRDAELVYVHYDILSSWQSFGWRRIGQLVLDEMHVLATTSRSLRLQAVSLLSLLAKRVVGVTGTPLWNKPAGLFGLLCCISPAAWGKWKQFVMRYASGRETPFGTMTGEPSNTEEFRARMTEIMIRREWNDVRDQLPVTKRDIKVLYLTPDQDREMTLLGNVLRSEQDTGTVVGTLARLRRILGEMKLSYLFEIVSPWFGKPFVIWCWHKDVADRITAELKTRGLSVYKVTGATSTYRSKKTGEVKREALLDEWRNDPAGILVINISVGQVGIDLSHASRAVFAELDFTPATIAQAEMRTFSPEREMEVVYLAAHHRVDEEIVEALRAKFNNSDLMGVPAADAAVEVLGNAFGMEDDGDLARLMSAVLEGDE